jgi:hypothetical protein
MAQFDLTKNPAPKSCRLIDFDKVEVHPGIIPETWFLVVSGKKPCLNMEVSLMPVVYIRCPEYWEIEVVGCLPHGICLDVVVPYTVTIPLAGITGSQGIEVVGASKSEKVKVTGGCKSATPSA